MTTIKDLPESWRQAAMRATDIRALPGVAPESVAYYQCARELETASHGPPMPYAHRQDVLGMALDLHMWCTGSGPDLSDEDRKHAATFLSNRLSHWVSGPMSSVFDETVRLLIVAVLQEVRTRLLYTPEKTTPDIPGMKPVTERNK